MTLTRNRVVAQLARWRALRNRRTDALWALITTGLVLLVLPLTLSMPVYDPALTGALAVIGVLFITFGGYILALEYRLAERRDRDRLDAAALRAGSRKENP